MLGSPQLDSHALSLIVRWIHVVAMAILVGGAALVLVLSLRNVRTQGNDGRSLSDAVATYEVLFWLALGLLILTGVGNLAAFGSSLPRPGSVWADKLVIKLALVAWLLVASLPSSIFVAMLRAGSTLADGKRAPGILSFYYTATVALLLAVLGLAVGLAHG